MTRADAVAVQDVIIERTLDAALHENLSREVAAVHQRLNRLEAEVRAVRAGRRLPLDLVLLPAGRSRPRPQGGR